MTFRGRVLFPLENLQLCQPVTNHETAPDYLCTITTKRGKMMNELDSFMTPFPVSFKVIGVGADVTDIINKVKLLGYDCLGCQVVNSVAECIPSDEDQMVIIVTRDKAEVANEIARTYHDAGVLTIGLLYDADHSCYDSVNIDAHFNDFPDIIMTLLQPIVTSGILNFDFNDLRTELRDSGFFKTLTAEAENVENAVVNIQKFLTEIDVKNVDYLSAHIYFNREKKSEIKMDDMAHLSNMISSLPESVSAMWSVNFDDAMPTDTIHLSIILSGKGLR